MVYYQFFCAVSAALYTFGSPIMCGDPSILCLTAVPHDLALHDKRSYPASGSERSEYCQRWQ
jgi:hypothetical protein